MHIKITYKLTQCDDFESLDKKLEELLNMIGFKSWSSGYNIEDGMRDIHFVKED